MHNSQLEAAQWRRIARFWKGLFERPETAFEERLEYVAMELRELLKASHVLIVVERRVIADDDALEGMAPIFSRDYGPDLGARERIRTKWMADEPRLDSDPVLQMTAAGAGRLRAIRHQSDIAPDRWKNAPVRRLLQQLGLEDRLNAVLPLNDDVEVVFCIDRPRGAPIFSKREAEVALAAIDRLRPFARRFVVRRGLMPGQRRLDDTEQRLFDLLLGARDQAAIADALGLDEEQIEELSETVFEKLAVDDRAGLLRMWLDDNSHISSTADESESAAASSGDTALGTGGFVTQVRQLIDESLRARRLDLETVARRLQTSPRRLQRALKSNGTHFRELVDKARHERALLLLSRPWLNLTEVAQELGYARVASLHRAVKRWTGESPAELRNALLEHS